MPMISQRASVRQTTPAPPREKKKKTSKEEEEGALNPNGPPPLPPISFACAESGMISTERQSGGRAEGKNLKKKRRQGKEVCSLTTSTSRIGSALSLFIFRKSERNDKWN